MSSSLSCNDRGFSPELEKGFVFTKEEKFPFVMTSYEERQKLEIFILLHYI